MTAEDALALLEPLLDSQYLSQTQKTIFQKVWEGQSYVKIAIAIGYDHGYVKDTGAQIWKLLSQVLGKKVTKNNVRNVICGFAQQLNNAQTIPITNNTTGSSQSWGEAVDVSSFHGREAEQARLENWVVGDRCRLVALLGIGGVGKTALSVKLAKRVQGQFDYVVWRSLRHAPPIEDLLPEIILVLSDQQDTQLPHTPVKLVELLLTYLHQHRCLLVLDNLESILQTGERVGRYRNGYEDYGGLLARVADEAHQSCVLITSREKLGGLSWREGDKLRVRSLQLTGLDYLAGQAIIRDAGLADQISQNAELLERYSGNPLALKIVAATIRSVFSGNVAEFLDYGTVVFGDLWDLLDQQFSRLSAIEQTVMRWLAINRDWISVPELRNDMIPPVPHRALLEAVESLQARSLIETSAAGITQQPVVMEYMTERLVAQFYVEINQREFDLFSRYALLKADAKEFVRDAQMRQLSRTLLEKLLSTREPHQVLEQQLQQLLSALRHQSADEVGYAGGNLLNLLCQLNVDLQGQDLSHLTIWQAYLSGQNLQQVNLAHSDLSKSVFNESLGSAIAVAFSPDGQLLAAGDTTGEIHLWTLADGRKRLFWKAHMGWVWSVSFSPDGQRLVTCSEDHTLKTWDVTTGQLLNTFSHRKRARAVVWHANGQQVVSGSEDHTIKVWDLATNTCVKTLTQPNEGIEAIALSPDGRFLASGGPVASIIQLWDVERGELITSLTGHTNGIYALTASPDNRTLISGGLDTTVRIWDMETGQCLKVLEGHREAIWAIATSADGSLIASGGEDRTVRIWDASTGQCLRTLHGFTARDWSVAFHPELPLLASSDDQTIKLWDVNSGQCLKTLRGYPQVNWTVAFTPDGSALISGGQEQLLRIWDLERDRCVQSLGDHPSYVHTLSHHPTAPVVVSGSDNTAYVWHLETGQRVHALEGHGGQVWQVAFSPTGEWVATASFDQTVKLWDWQSGTCLKTLQGHSSWVFGVGVSLDGQQLASSGMDKTIRVWDVSSGECLSSIETPTDWMTTVAFNPDGELIVGGGSQGSLVLCRLGADEPVQVRQGHAGFISAVSFAPDGKTFVTSGHDHTIKLWDVARFECVRTLTGHSNMVSAVVFSPDGKRLASASHDETVRVWDGETGQCLKVLRSPRPYEGMDIQGATGLTDAQRSTLKILGAVQHLTFY